MYNIPAIRIIIWVNSYHKSKRDRPIKWNSLIQFYHTYAIVRRRSRPVSVSSEPLGYRYSLFPIFDHKFVLLFVGQSVSRIESLPGHGMNNIFYVTIINQITF